MMNKSSAQTIANDAQDAARTIGNTARDAASNVGDDFRAVANRAGQQARRVFFTAKDELGSAADTVTGQIRQKPLQSTLIALGAGLLVGLLVRGVRK